MTVNLEGRKARCSYYGHKCKSETDSKESLPFFEYEGEGSRHATESCGICRYHACTHPNINEINPVTKRPATADHDFVPIGGMEFDKYYCGCYGWD